MIELCPRLFPAFARFVVCENQTTKEPKKRHKSPKSSAVAEVIQIGAESSAESSSSSEEDESYFETGDSLSASRVWFSLWFLTFSDLYLMNPEGSGSDAAFSII